MELCRQPPPIHRGVPTCLASARILQNGLKASKGEEQGIVGSGYNAQSPANATIRASVSEQKQLLKAVEAVVLHYSLIECEMVLRRQFKEVLEARLATPDLKVFIVDTLPMTGLPKTSFGSRASSSRACRNGFRYSIRSPLLPALPIS